MMHLFELLQRRLEADPLLVFFFLCCFSCLFLLLHSTLIKIILKMDEFSVHTNGTCFYIFRNHKGFDRKNLKLKYRDFKIIRSMKTEI